MYVIPHMLKRLSNLFPTNRLFLKGFHDYFCILTTRLHDHGAVGLAGFDFWGCEFTSAEAHFTQRGDMSRYPALGGAPKP
jgi:hypothetical protein